MDFCSFYVTYLKLIAGPEFCVEMQKKSCLKLKPGKNKTETIKFRSGCLMYKRIFKLPELSLMKRVNKISTKKIGEKIMKLKTQGLNPYKSLFCKNSTISNDIYIF